MEIGTITKSLSHDSIQYLNEYWKSLTKTDNGLRHNAETLMHLPSSEKFRNIIYGLVGEFFPNYEIVYSQMYADYKPGGIHSDGWIDQPEKNMGLTILIPFSCNYDHSATIVFNEDSEKAVTFNQDTGLGDNGTETYEQKILPNDGKPLDKNFYNLYMKHLNLQYFPFSISSVLYWKIGNCVFWPRKNFHMSAWFPSENVDRKAVVIHTNVK